MFALHNRALSSALIKPDFTAEPPHRSRHGTAALSVVLLALLSLASPLRAQPAADEPTDAQAERSHIAAERTRIDAKYAAEQQRCFKHFAVNDCRNDSRRRRDAERTLLRKREIELNDAERMRKAAVQRDNIEQRRLERERRAAEATAAESADPANVDRSKAVEAPPHGASDRRGGGPNTPMAPRAKPRDDQRARRATAAAERAERIAQEAGNVAQRDRLLREAAEHKADVLEKDAVRPKPAAPLPLPESAGRP